MPKPYTFPTLIDDLRCINISELNKWGYLKKGVNLCGTMTWRRQGTVTASIGIRTTIDNTPRLILNYLVNDEPVEYKIQLIEVESNLGFGSYYLFLCPFTYQRCRKLHLINGRFMHRSALTNAMYDCQTESKAYRRIKIPFENYVKKSSYLAELQKPYFKTHYNGKPTKRYLKLLNKMKLSNMLTFEQYQGILIFGA